MIDWDDSAFMGAYATTLGEYGGLVVDDTKDRCEQAASIARALVRVDTGRLRDSIEVHETAEDGMPAFDVGTNDVDYAADQEYGTSVMTAQPYMRPALAEALGVVV